MAKKDAQKLAEKKTLFDKIEAFEKAKRLVSRTHSQDGITYDVTTIRLEDGLFSVYLHITAVDGKDVSDDRLAANIFG